MLRRCGLLRKGDLVFAVLHDGNPQYGAPYNNHDRKMGDDEFHDFLLSVRGWSVMDSGAISKTFKFGGFDLAYDWMGRVMAFAYTSDRFPKLRWDHCDITVTIYSGKFHGLTLREARMAAFMNDQWFLLKKAATARDVLLDSTKDQRGADPAAHVE